MNVHRDLAAGRWFELSLLDQLGNIGSEVGRALRWHSRQGDPRWHAACERALDLFDLTLSDVRWRRRLKEIARAREVVCDYFYGGNLYGSTPESLDRYFTTFALAARKGR